MKELIISEDELTAVVREEGKEDINLVADYSTSLCKPCYFWNNLSCDCTKKDNSLTRESNPKCCAADRKDKQYIIWRLKDES